MPIRIKIQKLSWEGASYRIYRAVYLDGSMEADEAGNMPPPLSSNQVITLKGDLDKFSPSSVLEVFSGKWARHPKFGLSVETNVVVDNFDDNNAAIYAYLQGLDQVGPARARDIVKIFGDAKQTLSALIDHPEDATARIVEKVNGISPERGESLRAALIHRAARGKLLRYLVGLGLRADVIGKIYGALTKSPSDESDFIKVFQENPYSVALDGALSFYLCEEVARKIDPTLATFTEQRIAVAAALSVAAACQDSGATIVPPADIDERAIRYALGMPFDRTQLITAGVAKGIRLGYILPYYSGDSLDGVTTSHLYYAEVSIAKDITEHLLTLGDELQMLDDEELANLSDEQRMAVSNAARERVSVLTGGPGVGKTFTVKKIIEMFKKNNITVKCIAPTGVAAKRITEATGAPASTIHRFLAERMNDSTAYTSPGETAYIVDETSMVSTDLMSRFLDELGDTEKNRLVFVGDTDQLPSIDPGAVLRDFLNTDSKIPSTRLTRIFRQSSESAIPYFARAINEGAAPTPENDIKFIPTESDAESASMITDIICTQMAPVGIDVFRDVQILSPQNKGPIGTAELCTRLQETLNPQQDQLWIGGGFKAGVGDRVIHTQNNYTLNVFNGEQGIVLAQNFKGLALSTLDHLQLMRPIEDSVVDGRCKQSVLVVDFGDRKVIYPRSALGELILSYAITVHRSQGAQFPYVIMPISPAHSFMLTRNLLYTGVTRTVKRLLLVGQQDMLAKAAANAGRSKRDTRLVEKIAKIL